MSQNMSLRNFLKKYSMLSNEFIDDFYNIYEYNESNNNDFIINLETVAKWLNTEKKKLKQTLLNTYRLNYDWIVKKTIPKNKVSKSNPEIILITPETFKLVCLLSHTKKAEEVRTYYLELEKLINNYKNYIIENLQKTVNMLENNQKEVPENIKGAIYIIQSPKDIDGLYRFGQTQDFKKRIQNYNSAHSDKMKIIFIYQTKNAKKIESCVLSQIKELRYKKRKDFYEIDLSLLKNIIKSCDELTLKFKQKVNKNEQQNQNGGDEVKQNLYLYISK